MGIRKKFKKLGRNKTFRALSVIVALSLILVANCQGYRKRTGTTGRSSSEVSSKLADILSRNVPQSQGLAATTINDMLLQPGVTTYYSEAPSDLGSVSDVMPLDLMYMVSLTGGSIVGAVEKVWVYFIHLATDAGFRGAFVLQFEDQTQDPNLKKWTTLMVNDSKTTDAVSNGAILPGGIYDEGFEIRMNDASSTGTYILRTNDLDSSEEDLAEIIQLKVYYQEKSTGEEFFVGKINALESF